MVELYDDIAISTSDPLTPTVGWGSLVENEGKYWLNSASNVKFYHNGTGWVNYDSASGMAVTRTGVTLIGSSATTASVVLENAGGSLGINGSQVAVLGSAGQISAPVITITSNNPSIGNVNLENGGGNLIVNGSVIGGGSSITTGTQAQMLALSPTAGQQFLTCPSDLADSKMCFYNGETWQVAGQTFQMKSNSALPIGTIVETDLGQPDRVKKAQQTGDKDLLGVVVFKSATGANENVTIAYAGRWDVLCNSAT